MVLRPGARESSAPPVSFSGPPASSEAGGLFLSGVARSPRIFMLCAFVITSFLQMRQAALN